MPTPPKLTPEQQAYRKQLEAQVKSKAISQGQLEAEMARYLGTAPGTPTTPVAAPRELSQQMQQNKANLAQQVASGGINQVQADAELARLQGLEQTVRPTTGAIDLSTPQGVVQGQSDVNQQTINQQQGLGNLQTQAGPLGSRDIYQDPETGRWVQKDTLSQGQGDVLKGLEGSGTAANDMVTNLIKNGAFGSTMQSGEGTPASNYEKAVFEQLTRGLGERKAQEGEQMSQTLANRGIPVGSEAYNNAMKGFEKSYGDQYANAQNEAVKQATANQLAGISTLSGVGQGGFKNPEFQQFNAATGITPDVGAIFNTITGQKLSDAELAEKKRQFDIQNAEKNRGSGSGSGGSGRGSGGSPQPKQYTVPTPFSPGTPPGS